MRIRYRNIKMSGLKSGQRPHEIYGTNYSPSGEKAEKSEEIKWSFTAHLFNIEAMIPQFIVFVKSPRFGLFIAIILTIAKYYIKNKNISNLIATIESDELREYFMLMT